MHKSAVRRGLRVLMVVLGLWIVCVVGMFMPPWFSCRTEHLILYSRPFSCAARHIQEAAEVYEKVYLSAVKRIAGGHVQTGLKVYLHEHLDAMGFAQPALNSVHYTFRESFRLTSSHEMMHVHLHAFNPDAPQRFEEGVCRMSEVMTISSPDGPLRVSLVRMGKLMPSHRWVAQEVFRTHYTYDVEGSLAAAFARFSLDRLGHDRFWAMYRELDEENWPRVLRKFFAKDIEAVNEEFAFFMASLPDPPDVFR